MAGKTQKVEAIEKQIETYIADNYEVLQRPVTAFIIFEKQEG